MNQSIFVLRGEILWNAYTENGFHLWQLPPSLAQRHLEQYAEQGLEITYGDEVEAA
jgi:hypothetical protein